MDSSDLNRAALCDAEAVKGSNSLAEAPLNGKLNLRGSPGNPDFLQAVKTTLSLGPPLEANTMVSADTMSIFWLGPDEWLLTLPLDQITSTVENLNRALAGTHYALTEVSDYYSVIELNGPQAREVIQSASPLDIRPANFKHGQCAQTRFGHASILLWPIDDTPSFGIQVRWSYAQYVYDYLADSIRNAEAILAFTA